MEHAATTTTTPNEDHFLVRMHVQPFGIDDGNLFKIFSHDDHRTPQQLPLTAVLSSFRTDDDDDEKLAIAAEWKEIFQHWKYILEREPTTLFEMGHKDLFTWALILATFLFLMMLLDPENIDTHGMFGGCLVPLCFLWIKDAIRTNIRYSDNSNNNYDRNMNGYRSYSAMHIENENMDAITQYRSRMTTNRILLQVDNMSGIATCIGCFGLWVLAIFIVTQLKEYYLSGWGYVVAFLIPTVLISLYVLKHIGGWTSFCVSYRRRDMFGRHRREDILKKVRHEITLHNDALTYFTVRPQINYFLLGEILVDIYCHKSTSTSRGHDFEDGGIEDGGNVPADVLSSVSNNLGVTKRRGGNDHGFIVMIDGSSTEHQQQQQLQQQPLRMEHQLYYDDVHDGLSTPLLSKDTSV